MVRDVSILKQEIWKDIPGFEDRYAVSNLGRLRRKSRDLTYFHTRTQKSYQMHLDELILHPTLARNRYIVGLRCNKRNHLVRVDELVAAAFVPNPANKRRVKHFDNDPTNCQADNLFWYSSGECYARRKKSA